MCIGVKEHVCWHEWHVMLWHSPVVFFLGQARSPAWDGEDGKRERLSCNFETWQRKTERSNRVVISYRRPV